MRIALLGGTFDPIHYGHLRLAEEVREGLDFDRVLFVPACTPPHKPDGSITPAEVRFEMVSAAVADNAGFEVSDVEVRRGGRSFTVDTLRELKSTGPEDLELSLIVGVDSFNDITTWCEYQEIFKLSSFVVVPRPGYPVKKIAEVLPVELGRKFCYDSATESYVNSYGTSVVYAATTLYGTSSSDIRRRVAEGMSIRYLVPPAVEKLIKDKGLYR